MDKDTENSDITFLSLSAGTARRHIDFFAKSGQTPYSGQNPDRQNSDENGQGQNTDSAVRLRVVIIRAHGEALTYKQ